MKTLRSLLFASLFLSACSEPTQTSWTKADIAGLSIELMDPVVVESMTFGAEGALPLTLGRKDGPVTGPLFHWEFVDNRIRITADSNQPYDELALVERDARTITVRRKNGKTVRYRIRGR